MSLSRSLLALAVLILPLTSHATQWTELNKLLKVVQPDELGNVAIQVHAPEEILDNCTFLAVGMSISATGGQALYTALLAAKLAGTPVNLVFDDRAGFETCTLVKVTVLDP